MCYTAKEMQDALVNPTVFANVVLLTTWVVLAVVLLMLVLLYNVYPDQSMEGWVSR